MKLEEIIEAVKKSSGITVATSKPILFSTPMVHATVVALPLTFGV